MANLYKKSKQIEFLHMNHSSAVATRMADNGKVVGPRRVEKVIESSNEDNEARWATEDEFLSGLSSTSLTQVSELDHGGFPLHVRGDRVYYDPNVTHAIVIGATDTGKSRRLAMAYGELASRAGESLFFVDVKGELLRGSRRSLMKRGYDIHVINLRNPEESDSFDPLLEPYRLYTSGRASDRDLAEEMVADFAHTICPLTSADPYWDLSARSMISGLCKLLFEVCADESKIHPRSINALKTAILKDDYTVMEYIRELPPGSSISNDLSGPVFTAENTRRCIMGMLEEALHPLVAMDQVARITSSSDIDFRDMGRMKTAVFLVVPDEKSIYDRFVTMVVKQCYTALVSMASEHDDLSLPVRVNFVLDEFLNFPVIPDLDRMITSSRSRNIRLMLIAQSLGQFQSKYGKEVSGTVIGNCSNIIYMHSREVKTLEAVSDLAGRKSDGSALISMSKLQRLDKDAGEVLIMRGRKFPFLAHLEDISMYRADEPEMYVRTDQEKKSSEVPVFDVDWDFDPYWMDKARGVVAEDDVEDFEDLLKLLDSR